MLSQGIKAGNCFLTLTKVRILSLIAGKNTLATHCSIVFYVISILQDRFKQGLKGHVSFSSPPFHPSMQHPKFYTLSISSMILHFYHFLTCLIIPWISSCTISNSISQNVISSQPFHPHLKCLPFHPCIFHPRMTRIGWKRRVEYANMKLLG